MWEGNAPRCSCTGCDGCDKWEADGPGCWQPRCTADKRLALDNKRCYSCAPYRDEANASTQGKGAGKGNSSTGSGAAARDTRGEDDASIGELREVLRVLTEEIGVLGTDLRNLRRDFLNLKARVGSWERY